jgi:hypothetical protein
MTPTASDVAVLKAQVRGLIDREKETMAHDKRQDRALFMLEKKSIKHEMKHEELKRWIKIGTGAGVLNFATSGIDTIAWNILHHFGIKEANMILIHLLGRLI